MIKYFSSVFLLFTFFTSIAHSKGPISFGPISLGMTKTQIETLPTAAPFSLMSELTLDTKNQTPESSSNTQIYRSTIKTPYDQQPLKVRFTFENEKLTSIFLNLGDSTKLFNELKSQITEKYGAVKPVDTMATEQCIYRNGANFEIKSGDITYTWIEKKTPDTAAHTILSDFIADVCPESLNYRIGPMTLKSLEIAFKTVAKSSKKTNAF